MADKPKYANILDEFLDSREPSWKDLGLKDAKSSGDEWLERTHKEDDGLLDELAGASHHTSMPPTSKGATLTNRLREKDAAGYRIGAANAANTRHSADTSNYKSAAGDDESLLDDVTYSLEEAAKGGKIEKKNRSDGEIRRYVHTLLNQGETPAKVASNLKKLAEIEQFNHKVALVYLQKNAGILGTAYLEPHKTAEIELFNKTMGQGYLNDSDAGGTGMQVLENNTFMDKSNPQYGHTASGSIDEPGREDLERAKEWDKQTIKDRPKPSSQDCVRQAKAWKAAGITPRAKSVKQITACNDCTYFKKNGGSKSCGLYGLPVVGNTAELSAVVNRMTAGVPSNSKRAALVQIANRLPEQSISKAASTQQVHVSSYTKERNYGFKEGQHFSGQLVQKAHAKGHSLKVIATAAEKKFGPLETSKGIREFVASLRKEKGKIVMAKDDALFISKLGIHNEAIVGAAKCASCKAHTGKELHKAAAAEGVIRSPERFMETTLGQIRGARGGVVAHFNSASVDKHHKAGHSIQKILKAASAKFGSAQASKAVREWAHNLKNTNTRIALSQIDCTVLKKMGVKLSSKNAIIGEAKCGSCTYRDGMHCGLTGGTLLTFPGMNVMASNKKVAAGAPKDGHSMLKDFDLVYRPEQSTMDDIDMAAPSRAEVQMSSKMDAGEIE